MKIQEGPYRRGLRIETKIEHMIKNGVGQGRFENYIPWINHYMFSSVGRNTVVRGIKVNRLYELFSDLERDYFYILEYNQGVLDINEQKPLLDRKRAIMVANSLGVRYPTYPGTRVPYVMTSDFYITHTDGSIAIRTVKPKSQLNKQRVLEKFAIEQSYYEQEGLIDWRIVTEDQVNRVKAHNISLFRNFKDLKAYRYYSGLDSSSIKQEIDSFISMADGKVQTIEQLCKDFDKKRDPGAGFTMYRYLLANHMVNLDLNRPLCFKDWISMKGGELIVD